MFYEYGNYTTVILFLASIGGIFVLWWVIEKFIIPVFWLIVNKIIYWRLKFMIKDSFKITVLENIKDTMWEYRRVLLGKESKMLFFRSNLKMINNIINHIEEKLYYIGVKDEGLYKESDIYDDEYLEDEEDDEYLEDEEDDEYLEDEEDDEYLDEEDDE